MKINIITYKDQDIELSLEKNKLTWLMEIKGQRFGNAVELKSKKSDELIGTVASIVSNAILTYEELIKKSNEN
jgi:hypothetical protein